MSSEDKDLRLIRINDILNGDTAVDIHSNMELTIAPILTYRFEQTIIPMYKQLFNIDYEASLPWISAWIESCFPFIFDYLKRCLGNHLFAYYFDFNLAHDKKVFFNTFIDKLYVCISPYFEELMNYVIQRALMIHKYKNKDFTIKNKNETIFDTGYNGQNRLENMKDLIGVFKRDKQTNNSFIDNDFINLNSFISDNKEVLDKIVSEFKHYCILVY